MTEQDLHDYNKWLMEVWNPNQLYIPFVKDAPSAFLQYKKANESQLVCDHCGKDKVEELDHCECYKGTSWVTRQ